MRPAPEPIEIRRADPDLIDRIANALPEQTRAEYYRELRHCRSLPENDEMLRLLRAMQFLVLLIEGAPARVAEEREKLDKLLAATIDKVGKISSASETFYTTLQRRLTSLPGDIAYGINIEAVAGQINEHLQQEFVKSTIPQTAQALAVVSNQLKGIGSEFATSSHQISQAHRGAAEEARKAVAALKAEVTEAVSASARFSSQVAEKSSSMYRSSLMMLGGGILVIGIALGMMFERLVFPPQAPAAQPAATVQSAAPPAQK